MASETNPTFDVGNHEAFMEFALTQAKKSPPAGNKFCVGAVLVDAAKGRVLSTGAMLFYQDRRRAQPSRCIHEVLPPDTVLYTTMEPCNERLSGNMTCATRILRLKGAIKTVYVGIREPGTFIANNDGQERLEAHGVKVVYPVEHWHDRIMEISMAGH
ncbi:related to RIB2-DRAP deaminase [Fusarium fujikuroi IMI 58289]|uniref:Related to RIB2-DRAP deaminase n=1 Tax=Gibberella fujikuroi (strain CBS 195.34 / IMI 58289 / NRRL A-6831) TaxID=1279085 RepID=S0EIM5_GIBF5|nr:related to RIB2-DRAP deaminase [Fusarium fujikuroi IMI 58289]CCT73712.1 related to RIB2-DRAP deaminase [Fusarium fujikuroi IMI 58289]SCO10049.1 related to RIB2-DRAP deaminase [Fusarium fujikuroi]